MADKKEGDDSRRAIAEASTPAPTGKRLYEAPVLIRWGTLPDLTRAIGFAGASDGGRRGFFVRTHD